MIRKRLNKFSHVFLMSLLSRSIHAYMARLSIDFYAGSIWFFKVSSVRKMHTLEACRIFCFHIGVVLPRRGFPQVGPSIVGYVPVDVIDVPLRPRPSHIKPRQPVLRVGNAIRSNASVAVFLARIPCTLPAQPIAVGSAPEKMTAVRVVTKNLKEALVRYHNCKIGIYSPVVQP